MGLFGTGPKDSDEVRLKPGFRDMKWGDLPKKDMIVLDDHEDERSCMIKEDDLTLGGARVDKIVYRYFQARLSDVLVEIPASSASAVFQHLEKIWGKPSRPNRFIEDYFWQNQSHGVDSTTASFSRNPSTHAATLTIQSKYLQAKRNIAQGKEPGKL